MGKVSLTNKVYDHSLTVFLAFFSQIIGGDYFQFFSIIIQFIKGSDWYDE